MISKKMEDLLNEQINKEMFSANMYWAISAWFLSQDLDGFANYFKVQMQEEMFHAEKQFNYLDDVGGEIIIGAVAKPEFKFQSVLDAFEFTLAHEKTVTQSIFNLVKVAMEEHDYATHTFLQWFITEQVEEEAVVNQIISKLKMIGDNSSALYLLNTELATRTFTPEAN